MADSAQAPMASRPAAVQAPTPDPLTPGNPEPPHRLLLEHPPTRKRCHPTLAQLERCAAWRKLCKMMKPITVPCTLRRRRSDHDCNTHTHTLKENGSKPNATSDSSWQKHQTTPNIDTPSSNNVAHRITQRLLQLCNCQTKNEHLLRDDKQTTCQLHPTNFTLLK